LDIDDRPVAHPLREDPIQKPDAPRMATSDRAHPHDLSFDQLNPIVLREDPRLGHPMILIHGEQPP